MLKRFNHGAFMGTIWGRVGLISKMVCTRASTMVRTSVHPSYILDSLK